MRSMEGIVTIVQEARFQLLDQDGVSHLFLLSHSAAPDPEQLPALARDQSRVRVAYTRITGVIAHRARRIMLMDPC
jgi:hypothetical protein